MMLKRMESSGEGPCDGPDASRKLRRDASPIDRLHGASLTDLLVVPKDRSSTSSGPDSIVLVYPAA
jgi:hypothetical protein